ncbi:MAG: hypothetical protein GY711_21405 [bacterium]|nr:hypothetical protein [bacterium]
MKHVLTRVSLRVLALALVVAVPCARALHPPSPEPPPPSPPGLAAPLDVCGLIPVGEVWSLAHSPVRVTCDLILAGLTIEPGVEVLVTGNYEIVVDGYLRSLGTASAPVLFSTEAGVAGWKGLYFEDAPGGSELRWTEIENATSSAVHLVRSAPTFAHVTFRANSASNGGGLRAELLDQDLVLSNCVFEGNYADYAGGGIHVVGPTGPADAALVLTDALFIKNRAGTTGTNHNTKAGAVHVNGNARILRSTFLGNEARAYTIYAAGGRYTQGGSLFLRGGHFDVTACSFLENGCRMGAHSQTPDPSRAYGGAIYQHSGDLFLANSLLAWNLLSVARNPVLRGAGLHCAGGTAAIVNTTLARNTRHAIYSNASSVEVTNSILFDNNASGSQISDASGALTATYSDIQNGFPGEGNILTNPVFDAYFRIVPPSPAIDGGLPDPGNRDVFPIGLGGARADMGFTGGRFGAYWDAATCHRDADGDGFGDPQAFAFTPACTLGFVPDGTDCDDSDSSVYPGAGCPDTTGGVCGLVDRVVWSLANSPVYVSCDLNVASLIIEAGVEVHVADDRQIVVNGLIRCLGTPEAPVVFKPTPGSSTGWGGLFFRDTMDGSEFRWTEIEGATTSGVHLVRSTPTFDHVTFRGNSASYGGGLRAELSTQDLVLTDCVFEGNYASYAGGGGYVVGPTGPDDAALVLTANTFTGNNAGTTGTHHNTSAGALHVDGNARIDRSEFIQNEARAYTIYASGGRYTRGGALFVRGGRFEITASLFLSNACRMGAHSQTPDASRAHGGTIYHKSGELHLANSLLARGLLSVARNPDLKGSGLHTAGGVASITNTTMARNSRHAIYVNGGVVSVANSILFDNNNGASQVWDASSTLSATYSAIQNGFPGQGNIASSPIFVDASNDDYRVSWGSPCIDTGDQATQADGLDLDGFQRPLDGDLDLTPVVDMGSHEFAPLRQHGAARLGGAIDIELWGPNGSTAELLFVRGLPLSTPVSTPVGELWLSHQRQSLGTLPVAAGPPYVHSIGLGNDPALVGESLSFQSLVMTGATPVLALSNLVVVEILP